MVRLLLIIPFLFSCKSSVDSDFLNDPILISNLNLSAPLNILLTGLGGEMISPQISWQEPAEVGSGIANYEISIGTSAGGEEIIAWTAVPVGSGVTTYTLQDGVDGFSLTLGYLTNYYVSVRAVDTENNISAEITSSWQIAWTPRALGTALKAWFDGQDATTFTIDGSTNVSDWVDKSDNSYVASQGTPSARPAYIDFLNGKALNFTDNTKKLVSTTATTLLDADGFSAYFVVQVPAAGTWRSLLSTFNTQAFSLYATSSGPAYRLYNGGHTTTALQSSAAQVLGYIARPSSNFIDRRDGAQISSTGIGAATFAANVFSLGNYITNQAGTATAAISEVVLLETDATAAEWEIIEGYLSHKWGLDANLPGGHPYKASPP